MNRTLFFKYTLLGSLLSFLLPIQAQRGNVLALHDSLSGKDTILLQVSLIEDHPQKMQYSISIEVGNLKTQKFTPAQVPIYRQGKTTFLSRTLEVQGKERQVFLRRVLWQPLDTLSILQFINDQNHKEYYYQFGSGKKVLPLTAASGSSSQSALTDYLLGFPIAQQDKQLREYIRQMKPAPKSYKKRQLICLKNNINYLPKFRWGILAGMGFSQLEMENGYNFNNQWQWYAGAFISIPLRQKGLSFHPELTFLKISALRLTSPDFNSDLAYNRTSLQMPLLFRYTVMSIHRKILPYLQFGPELNFHLKGDTKTYNYPTDENGYTQPLEKFQEKNKSFLMAGTAGLGVELRLQRNHSLFIDARYLKDFTSDIHSFKTSGWFTTISYNL